MDELEKEFVPYELSLRLKLIGFDKPCFGVFFPSDKSWKHLKFRNSQQDNIVASPLFSQAFRWFREKYKLRNSITDFIDDKTVIEWDYEITIIGTDLDEKGNYKPFVDYSTDDETRKFKTYEEAEYACLEKLIEIVQIVGVGLTQLLTFKSKLKCKI